MGSSDSYMEIFCPFCGNSMDVKIKEDTSNIICEMCGSDLDDEIVRAKKQVIKFKEDSKSDPEEKFPDPTSPSPAPGPFSKPNKESGASKRGPFGKKAPSFPDPTGNVGYTMDNTVFPSRLHSKPQTVYLDLVTISQKLALSSKKNEHHFGRSIVLKLLPPGQKSDLEWFNSISRIRTNSEGDIMKQHFIISKSDNGQYSIEDKRSTWGTWLNGRQIRGLGKFELFNGDLISLKLGKPNIDEIREFKIRFIA